MVGDCLSLFSRQEQKRFKGSCVQNHPSHDTSFADAVDVGKVFGILLKQYSENLFVAPVSSQFRRVLTDRSSPSPRTSEYHSCYQLHRLKEFNRNSTQGSQALPCTMTFFWKVWQNLLLGRFGQILFDLWQAIQKMPFPGLGVSRKLQERLQFWGVLFAASLQETGLEVILNF